MSRGRPVFNFALWTGVLIFVLLLASCKPQAELEQGNATAGTGMAAAVDDDFSVYIAMPDGVKLAAEVLLPAESSRPAQIPAIVEFTRYWRAADMEPPPLQLPVEISQSLAAGYAYIVVDVRGTGASQGVRKAEFSLAEARDMPHVIDWISGQSWSNGKVAAMGVSYPGNTAEMAALFRHPALVAAVPKFTDFDWYASIVVPGGLKNHFITVRWGAGVRKLDLNDASVFGEHEGEPTADNPLIRGVRPVDSDVDGSMLAAASRAHQENASLADQLETLVYRDEYPIAEDLQDSGDKATSVHRSRRDYENIALPMYQWGSWFDAGTAAGILARFAEWDVPYRFVIGAWSHGGGHDANPYAERDAQPQPSVEQQFADTFAFLDPLMKSESAGPPPAKELRYYTVGENAWKTTLVWPPRGQVMQRWYLQANNALAQTGPPAEAGFDEYAVDFEAGTGTTSRWATQLGGGDVYYGDRTEADRQLLTYTSAPLDADTEITGNAVVSLEISSTHADGAFIVYLEDVAPDGYVRMLSEGQLRGVHRALSDTPTYETFGPFHSFERKDGKAMVPGEITTVSFALLPVSVLVRKGHSIRVAIAGHDKDTFIRVPGTGDPVIRVFRQQGNVSWIKLPVIQKE
jgi:putative CocE/NonD family hydrolase